MGKKVKGVFLSRINKFGYLKRKKRLTASVVRRRIVGIAVLFLLWSLFAAQGRALRTCKTNDIAYHEVDFGLEPRQESGPNFKL